MPPLRLEIRALRKSFGPNLVLRGLNLAIAPGEIHALIGGNGAGKSTLSKIIAGLEPADAGELLLDGVAFAPRGRRGAQAAGVVMVLQELSVLPTLSVGENLFLDRLPARWGMLNRARLRSAARAALARVGLADLDPDRSAATLGVGHQQLLEIAAGLAQTCRLLILDEPTAALTGAEVRTLFALLRELRTAGTSILYISHRLDEVVLVAERVSVLRDGQLVATLPAAETPRERLIELMAGAPALAAAAPAIPAGRGERALRLAEVQSGRAVRGVSLELQRGEIVGLGGLIGAGRTELLRTIFGADPLDAGRMYLGPEQRPFSPTSTAEAAACGFAFVPEDRKHHGLFARQSVRMNTSIARLPCRSWFAGALDHAAEVAGAAALLESLQVRRAADTQPIDELSGGNQQKVIIGRWLRRDVRIWLLDEPTRGVDVAARVGIYRLLRARAAAGEAILIASSDYDELATLCDRVIVLSNGVIAGEFTRTMLTPERFTTAAFRGFGKGAAA